MSAMRLTVALALLLAALPRPVFALEPELQDQAEVSAVSRLEPPVPLGRLDGSVVPARYRLDLTIDPAKERFAGKAEIDAVLARPSRTIDLHGRGLAVRDIYAVANGIRRAGTWEQLNTTGAARIRFADPLPAGPATLFFTYEAPFNDGPSGLFRVNVGGEWYVWSQFQSIDARSVFPSFDEPSFKTPFAVTLRTPEGLTAISNSPQIEAVSDGKSTLHRYAPTLPLPTYLVAMMVGPFTAVESVVAPSPQRSEPLPLRIVSTAQNEGKLDFALAGSQEIVRLLEDYFGDAFPYPKLDQITSPVMPGAMENAGADLYRDGLIVMDARAPVSQQRRFGMVVAHELGHQWFGDLVTPA